MARPRCRCASPITVSVALSSSNEQRVPSRTQPADLPPADAHPELRLGIERRLEGDAGHGPPVPYRTCELAFRKLGDLPD